VGYGMPWWLMLGAGGALLVTTYWFVSKPVEVV
jgi:hypothetical protein